MKNKSHSFKSILLFAVTSFFFLQACDDNSTGPMAELRTAEFEYAFNEGQLLNNPATSYSGEGEGDHPRNLTARLVFEERADGNANITVILENAIDGETYAVHAHDMADPSTTPNGTPYIESPNGNVFASALTASNGMAMSTNETSISYDEIANNYEGFLVVHDPTQAISTTDISTYLILGVFGQTLAAGEPNLRTATFSYDLNEGQLLNNPSTGYDGDHPRNIAAAIKVDENIDGTATVTITLSNTLNNITYPVHAHDAADPSTTPNGTPYNETPNSNIFAGGIQGNGGSAMATNELTISYNQLLNEYNGFFVVHDPTQDISTTDLTTYLILGLFAR